MYIEVVDETKGLSDTILNQSLAVLNFAADYLQLPEQKEMSLTFVDNKRSQEINREYRGIDAPTDVISLEYTEEPIKFDGISEEDLQNLEKELDPFIGELYISTEKAREQAEDYGHSLAREYGWLVVHGFLHINGYDHMTKDDEEKMFALQEEILEAYGLRR